MRAVWLVFVPPPRSSRCSGRGSASSSKKTCESDGVVVLARVDEHLVRSVAQAVRHGGRLDELRPVADDRQDPHAVIATMTYRGNRA